MRSKYSNGKGNYFTRAQDSSILKENDSIREKNAASKNEMVAVMKEELERIDPRIWYTNGAGICSR